MNFLLTTLLCVGVMSYIDPIDEDELEREQQERFNFDMWHFDFLPEGMVRDGKGPLVYVFDSGINKHHVEFRGKVVKRYDFSNMTSNDIGGHGTHVAGTIGGSRTGVAPNADLVSVKVCETRSCPYVDDALEWFYDTQGEKCKKRGCVINMSLGGSKRSEMNALVNKIALELNTVVVVAAGNEADDSSLYSPASAKYALTIGSVTRENVLSYFSNAGDVVDAYLPGSEILSTYFSRYEFLSGTSMATPFATGMIANYWSVNPEASAFEIKMLFLRDNYKYLEATQSIFKMFGDE